MAHNIHTYMHTRGGRRRVGSEESLAGGRLLFGGCATLAVTHIFRACEITRSIVKRDLKTETELIET